MKYLSRVRALYRKNISEHDREARFLVLIFFTFTFVIARLTVYSIKYHWFPQSLFSNIYLHDMHIHHLVFGIILLLVAGIIRIPRWDDTLVRFSSIVYGIGAALTLDEFSLWLKLNPDVYFGPQGRISIDAVVVFILILVLTLWYGNFWRRVFDHTIVYIFYFFHRHKFFSKKPPGKRKKFLTVLLISTVSFSVTLYTFLFLHNKFLIVTPVQSQKKHIVLAQSIPTAICSPTNPVAYTPTRVSVKPPAWRLEVNDTQMKSDYCLHVPVLYYHHIQPWPQAVARGQIPLSVDNTVFDQQMLYLITHGYTSISTTQLVQALRNHLSLPQKSVVLTFDDAYSDIYTYAFPVFKKYHLIANLAVPTGLLGIQADMNYYFTWDQLKEMVDSGLVNADDHTWSHYGLGLGDASKDQFEIMTSKDQLERYLNKPVEVLVYPYGSYKPWLFPLLSQDGILGAFTTSPGTMQCSSQIFALPRTRIANGSLTSFGL